MNSFFNYSIYFFFGIMPSLLWLQFYLREDVRPEPKKILLKVFFYGMLITIPAICLEKLLFAINSLGNLSPAAILILKVFVGVAFIEEYLKFLVIKMAILNNPEFDEPIDAMIYMIVAALGFAAAENLLVLFPFATPVLQKEILEISVLRFLGATFLHALSSGLVGFFIGLSFFKKEKRGKLIFAGLFLAVLLHGFYNFFIINIEKSIEIFTPFSLLIIAAILISFGFKKLKYLKSI